MTAEQHTSIAHSDGDTIDPMSLFGDEMTELDNLIAYAQRWELHARKGEKVEAANYRQRTYALRNDLTRRLERSTPDQIRAALDVIPTGKALNADHVTAILDRQAANAAALFDAEVTT